MIKKLLIIATLALATSCNDKTGAVDVKSDKGQFSYAVGHEIGKNMKRQGVELHFGSFIAGLKDVMTDKKIQLDETQRREAMKKMAEAQKKKDSVAASANTKKSDDFLAKNKTVAGVMTTSTGLQYKVIKEGTGAKPKATDTVKVHYKGTLLDGSEFDSSYKRKTPIEFPLNGVIPGWTEGVQLMTVGSKYQFWISPQLGYGAKASPKIPGNSLLVFEVELLDITTGKDKK